MSKEVKPQIVKVHRRPKTERRYERVIDIVDFCRVLEKHGDRIAFSYFDKDRNIVDLTYTKLNAKILRIAAGLTEENARAAATLGVAAAKERATSRLLEMILEQRLQAARVTEYARSMGFNDEELERFAAYAKQINSTKVPSQLPGDLFD